MDACTHPAAATPPTSLAAAARVMTTAIAAWAQRFGAWRAELAKVARDRETLAQMSERELHDIGLDRGVVDQAASGAWQRDAGR